MGLSDRHYLSETYGTKLGKAPVTSYSIKFKKISDIDELVLLAAIKDGVEKTAT